jgi:tRNA isopentenyl-2-thiomethyl-A-37 hydroxylase MiaE
MGVLDCNANGSKMGKHCRKKHRGNLDGSCLVRTKAATNAITIITNNSEHQDLVQDLWLAKEELDHFEQVHNIIIKRGLKLGRERSLRE